MLVPTKSCKVFVWCVWKKFLSDCKIFPSNLILSQTDEFCLQSAFPKPIRARFENLCDKVSEPIKNLWGPFSKKSLRSHLRIDISFHLNYHSCYYNVRNRKIIWDVTSIGCALAQFQSYFTHILIQPSETLLEHCFEQKIWNNELHCKHFVRLQ